MWKAHHLHVHIGDAAITERDHKTGATTADNDRHTPVEVQGLTDIKQIAADWVDSYAVKQDGTLWAWGEFFSAFPIQLLEWSGVESISVGYASDLLILKQDGTVWQMGTIPGSVYYGKQIASKRIPQQVSGLTDIVAVANGAGCYFALKNDGSVWSWGINKNGQLGDGTYTDRTAPVKIEGISDVVAVQATAGGPIYLKKDGTVWGNGHNSGGQLGIGTYEDRNVPVRFIAEAFGAAVDWNADTKTVMITRDDAQTSGGYIPEFLNIQLAWLNAGISNETKIKPLEKHLSSKLGIPVRFTSVGDHYSVVEALAAKRADIGFLPPNYYVLAHDKRQAADLLVQTLRQNVDEATGQNTEELVDHYKAMLVVKKESPIKSIAELKGKKVGWQSTSSAAGYMYPAALLKKNGIDPEKDVQSTTYRGHDRAITALLNGDADVVAVFRDVRTAMIKDYPRMMTDTRVLSYTGDIPNDVIAVRPGMDAAWKKNIQDAFSAFGQSSEERKLLEEAFRVEGFAASDASEDSDDSKFDIVRETDRLIGFR